jgi:hypothetical protein
LIKDSDVVFATSSLEVGYDDPDITLVYQHYAPQNLASFVQRKGRGGRGADDRPITGVTLSIYSSRDSWWFRRPREMIEPTDFTAPLNPDNFFVRRGQLLAAVRDAFSRPERPTGRAVRPGPRIRAQEAVSTYHPGHFDHSMKTAMLQRIFRPDGLFAASLAPSFATSRPSAFANRRHAVAACLVSIAALLGAKPVSAQIDTLKVMIGENPGGGFDQTGRSIAAAMQAAGVVRSASFENRGGAGGTIGLAQFVNTEKGNPNALIVTGAVMVGAIEMSHPPVTLKNGTPIARLFADAMVVVVPAVTAAMATKTQMAVMAATDYRLA